MCCGDCGSDLPEIARSAKPANLSGASPHGRRSRRTLPNLLGALAIIDQVEDADDLPFVCRVDLR